MNDKIKEKLKTLPDLPGSYQMLDKDGKIIYVGKAKNLKNRVRSYFIGAHNDKTTALVSKIDDLTYITTKSEKEAFLLEISLIKEHQPFYNIDLTDDKTYPYIEFTNEKNPKLIITRKISKKNNKYFGPYSDVKSARETQELLMHAYKIRRCNTVPKKSCIYYDIHECNAPCINNITKEEYDLMYQEIKSFLNGNNHDIINKLKKEMAEYSEKLDFENAKKCRDLISSINATVSRQDIMFKEKLDCDAFGFSYDDSLLSITIIYVRNGKIVFSKGELLNYYFDLEDTISTFVSDYYSKNITPKQIFINSEYTDIFKNIVDEEIIFTPQKGTKKELLDMAKSNSQTQLDNRNKIQIDKKKQALEELASVLNINIPYRIESFDNSNLFGDNPVSSCVVFVSGKKQPKEYRKYRVKSVVGPNDFETMKEVIFRRYTRLLDENKPLPDLILMDGGEIQVNAATEILASIGADIKVAGMVKDDNHNTNTLLFNGITYDLDKHSESFRLLFEIQEEVHRFAITYHRTLKNNSLFDSILDDIPGIGGILKERLLVTYHTLDNMKDASMDELKELGLSEKAINALKEKLDEEVDYE